MCACARCRWRPHERQRQQRHVLPEHAHLPPLLAGLQELPGQHPLLGPGGLAPEGRRSGHPGGLHAPRLRQHAGGLPAPAGPGESEPGAGRGLSVDEAPE